MFGLLVAFLINTWNPKQPFINGCFNWMISNLYIGNGCFTKHLFINGCLGFQENIFPVRHIQSLFVLLSTIVPPVKLADTSIPTGRKRAVSKLCAPKLPLGDGIEMCTKNTKKISTHQKLNELIHPRSLTARL